MPLPGFSLPIFFTHFLSSSDSQMMFSVCSNLDYSNPSAPVPPTRVLPASLLKADLAQTSFLISFLVRQPSPPLTHHLRPLLSCSCSLLAAMVIIPVEFCQPWNITGQQAHHSPPTPEHHFVAVTAAVLQFLFEYRHTLVEPGWTENEGKSTQVASHSKPLPWVLLSQVIL